jgi:DNA polymerase-3 subunit beta
MQHNSAVAALAASLPSAVIEYKPFLAAAVLASHVVERRNTIPILSNVRLTGDGESIRFVGTDLDIECAIRIPAAADSRLDVTIPAHLLADMAKKTKRADMVALDVIDGGDVRIDFGGPSTSIQTLPAADFPVLDRPAEWAADFILSTDRLRVALSKVEFAISSEATRYYLGGVFVHVIEKLGAPVLRFVATDGHRLARYDLPAPDSAAGMPGVIIPRKAVDEFLRATKGKDVDQSTRVRVAESRIEFAFGAVTMLSKLIDGTFPDYSRVTPSWNDKIVRVNRDEFAGMVRQVSAISTDRDATVKLSICPEGMTGSANNPGAGQSSAEILFDEEAEGEPLDVGFSGRYLLDFCKVVGERIEFQLADPGSPALILDRTDPAFLGVLMPKQI